MSADGAPPRPPALQGGVLQGAGPSRPRPAPRSAAPRRAVGAGAAGHARGRPVHGVPAPRHPAGQARGDLRARRARPCATPCATLASARSSTSRAPSSTPSSPAARPCCGHCGARVAGLPRRASQSARVIRQLGLALRTGHRHRAGRARPRAGDARPAARGGRAPALRPLAAHPSGRRRLVQRLRAGDLRTDGPPLRPRALRPAFRGLAAPRRLPPGDGSGHAQHGGGAARARGTPRRIPSSSSRPATARATAGSSPAPTRWWAASAASCPSTP